MSELLKSLNEKVQSAQDAAEVQKKNEQAEKQAENKKDEADGINKAVNMIPEIENEMAIKAEKGEKEIYVEIAPFEDSSKLSVFKQSYQNELMKHFQGQGLTVKADYHYDDASGSDSYYGRPNYNHYLLIKW